MLTSLHDSFKRFDGARILITGGSGFVGKWLLTTAKFAQETFNNKIEIIVLTRDANARHVAAARRIGCPNVHWVDYEADPAVIGDLDLVVHAATPASAYLTLANPLEMFRINVESTIRALQFAHDGIPFLFTSSGAIYGNQPDSLSHIHENLDKAPSSDDDLNSYAVGKICAERVVRLAGSLGVCQPIIARLFTFGGLFLPLDLHFALGNFVSDALSGRSITVRGNPETQRSYLDGGDMATWIWSALAQTSTPFPLHIGSEQGISILDLAQLVSTIALETLGIHVDVVSGPNRPENNSTKRYIPSTRLTRKYLNVNQWTSLATSIKIMLQHAPLTT